MYIKLDDIIPNRFQPREIFDEEALDKLAESIKQHGVIEPILVRPVSNKYEIIAGERRYKASVLAGLTKIPAMVRQLDDKESSILAFIENEHRSDVSAIEEARTMERILKTNNMTQEELGKELGINQSTIANKIRLLNLPLEIQEALMRNEISERHARSLLTIKDEEKQLELLRKIKEKRMTVRELDSEIKDMNIYENNQNNDEPAFMNFLNNYDNNVESTSVTPTEEPGFMNFLNNYDNNNPLPQEVESTPVTPTEEPEFMNFLNNYDNNNPLPQEVPNVDVVPEVQQNNGFNENIYSNFNETANNVIINNVVPPITTDFNNQYIEDNPNYIDVSKQSLIDNVDEIINRLKNVVDDIKNNSKFKIDTDEINYDDIYQITIKIDKRDF